MRFVIITDKTIRNTYDSILYHGEVLANVDYKEKNHNILDNMFRDESKYEHVGFQVREQHLVPWVKAYIEGNNINMISLEALKDLINAAKKLNTELEKVDKVEDVENEEPVTSPELTIKKVKNLNMSELRSWAKHYKINSFGKKKAELQELIINKL